MKFDVANFWNQQHLKNGDKQPSDYAKDKEKFFPANSIVCDLGGGDGVDSIYFLEKGHQVYLFDIANLALKKAEEKAKSIGLKDKLMTEVVDLNKDKIPASDDFFDVVYSRLSLHYFYQDRTTEILKDIYRVLKTGGVASIVVKSPEDKEERDWFESHYKKLEPGIYSNDNGLIRTRFTKEQYQSILEKTEIKNFEIKDYTETFGDQKIYVKCGADKLLYIEIIIKK